MNMKEAALLHSSRFAGQFKSIIRKLVDRYQNGFSQRDQTKEKWTRKIIIAGG